MYWNYIGFQQNVGSSTEIYPEGTAGISVNGASVGGSIYHEVEGGV